MGLGLLLAILCLPILLPAMAGAAMAASATGPLFWLILTARELLVGLTVGLCAGATFRAAEAAGRLADILRGANLAEVLSPTSDERTSPTADLYLFVTVVVFLELGGLRFMVSALARSYEAVPIGELPHVAAFRAAAVLVVATTGRLMESAIGLAAPVVVALWVTDVALGVVGRAAPQIPIYFAAMPAKALLGLGVVLVGLGAVEATWTSGFSAWTTLLQQAFAIWRSPEK